MLATTTYAAPTGSISRSSSPQGCFRLLGPGVTRADHDASKGADYLAGWTASNCPAGQVPPWVAWGRVDWEEDPFEDLKCDAIGSDDGVR